MHMGLIESWQADLQEVLASLSSERQRHRLTQKKLHFQIQNCLDVHQETNHVCYMSLPKNVIINIPIVASLVADAPFDKENAYFEIEILTMADNGTIVVGAVDKNFQAGYEPGSANLSVGYSVADGSVRVNCNEEQSVIDVCKAGDRVGCGIDFDKVQPTVYFTKNGNHLFDIPLTDVEVPRYPAISMSSPKEEVLLLQDAPWRSSQPGFEREVPKLCRDTGQLFFRSTKEGGRDATLVANHPLSKQFAYFEIEIRAFGPEDEISIGGVPEDYSLRKLPGCHPLSLAYHGRVGGIFPGVETKRDDAPKCSVGDKMGCGIEHLGNGKRHLYFTHNSKSFMEAELNDHCPANLYPAIGMRSRGATVCVCLLDCSRWGSADDDIGNKLIQIDMTSKINSEPETVVVDKETARASFVAPVGVTKDAILLSENPLSMEGDCSYFEIEIMYGKVVTIGLTPKGSALVVHPGWTKTSIGYNADSGCVYNDGEVLQTAEMKSNYGDRIGCGVKQSTSDDKQIVVYFKKNGSQFCELPFGDDETAFCPAIAMRSAGQVLSIKLLQRDLWSCHTKVPVKTETSLTEGLTCEILDRELIECPICRDVFTDPRILPCSVHTFCSDCLRKYIEQHEGKRSVPCPVCQKMFVVPSGGVSDLPSNPLITRLMEIRNQLAK